MLKKTLKDTFVLATSLIARSSFRTVTKSASCHENWNWGRGEVVAVAQDVIPGLYLQTLLCCVYLELPLSILRTWGTKGPNNSGFRKLFLIV